MATSSLSVCPGQAPAHMPVGDPAPAWYAAYTCANHEKKVAGQLAERDVEHYLPTFEAVRRWSDRSMRIQQPLFPGYVFVRLSLRERLRVLQVPSVVRLVGFNGSPAPLPDREIETLRRSLIAELGTSPHPYLKEGTKVRIVRGPLEGAEGILIRKKNIFRVVISIDLILRAASVEVDIADVQRI